MLKSLIGHPAFDAHRRLKPDKMLVRCRPEMQATPEPQADDGDPAFAGYVRGIANGESRDRAVPARPERRPDLRSGQRRSARRPRDDFAVPALGLRLAIAQPSADRGPHRRCHRECADQALRRHGSVEHGR